MKRIFLFILLLFSVVTMLIGLTVALDTNDPHIPSIVEPLDTDTPSNTIPPLSETDIPDVEEETEDTTEDPIEDTPVEEETVVPVFDYTEEELDLLARLIFSEGGIESYETQLKIGSVVMNRVMSDEPYFPDDIRGVIYQENQFSVTFIRNKDGILMIDQPADEEAKKAAYEVLTYGSVLPPDVQVFFHKRVTTGWVATREPYGTFDHTTFAYIYEKGEK